MEAGVIAQTLLNRLRKINKKNQKIDKEMASAELVPKSSKAAVKLEGQDEDNEEEQDDNKTR